MRSRRRRECDVRRGPHPCRERDLLWLGVGGAILVFVVLAMLWVFRVPTYRPPDEASHVAYARELSHGRLPTIDTPISSDDDARLAAVLQPHDTRHRAIWTANPCDRAVVPCARCRAPARTPTNSRSEGDTSEQPAITPATP